MTTPATIQVQQGETMTNSIPSNQPTGDQRAEIAAHAPGPWNARDDGITSLVSDFDDHPIAVTYGMKGQSANARLIAAAPDVLEALKTAVRLYETYGLLANLTGRNEDKMATGIWVNAARAAIAKAEGQS